MTLLLMDKISVITVCYNETPERIRYTLDSIIGQEYSPLELVVMDGGSKIETLVALNSYKDKIATFISEPDHGIYDAMNKGIQHATGEWIIFMNIGDRFHSPNVLSEFLKTATIQDTDMAYGDVIFLDPLVKMPVHHRSPSTLKKWYMYNGAICHQAMLIRKKIFNRIGGFDISLKLIADREWSLRFIQAKLIASHINLRLGIRRRMFKL